MSPLAAKESATDCTQLGKSQEAFNISICKLYISGC